MHSPTRRVIAITLPLVAAAAAWAFFWGPFASDRDSPEPTVTTTAAPTPSAAPVPGDSAPSTTPAEATPGASSTPSPEPTVTSPPAIADPAPSRAVATVVITYASWATETSSVEVGAYAAVVENTGQCTLTLTKGTTVRSQTLDALSDVSTMSCGGFLIPGSDLSTGTWSAIVTYVSERSSGQSDPIEVTVP